MAQSMQEKLTGEFERVVTGAGLEFVTRGHPQHQTGTWHAMDGLDTRLVIHYSFLAQVSITLEGQVLNAPDLDFFKDRQLYPQGAGSHVGRSVKLGAEYGDGDRLRRLLDVVGDLLAPYAKPVQPVRTGHPLLSDEPMPGESLASRHAAETNLASLGLNQHAIALVIRRAYGHLTASFNCGDEQLGYVDYDREQGIYAVRMPDVDEAADELLPWQRGHAASAVLFAEVLFSGETRLDAMSYDGLDLEAALGAVRAALAAGTVTEAYVHYPDGTVALDSKAPRS